MSKIEYTKFMVDFSPEVLKGPYAIYTEVTYFIL